LSKHFDEESNMSTQTTENRLEELGLSLPSVMTPAGSYVPYVRLGKLLFVSGQIPLSDSGAAIPGRVGQEVSTEQANNLARSVGLSLLAVVRSALPSLDHVRRVVQLRGYVNAVPGFSEQPAVMNGCSDLMVEVLGDRGKHARAAVGVASLPMNVPVEVEGVFEVGEEGAK
jgi:enamine deaminase RidA (YjgF/YER057c/UK114 family)